PTEKEAQQIIFTLGMTPDSLRSPEQKALMEKFEMILYEHCSIKNERLEVSISKKEFKTMGVPEIYYDMLKKDVENINHYLDTTTSVVLTADLIMDSFRKSGKEYNATKK
ncbi:MAG: hypothetical protein LBP72_10215, partial [Dysgonamonadaceae bacterium]|nr:hypothetical protein [Dysgonamonadaceae bacterium]